MHKASIDNSALFSLSRFSTFFVDEKWNAKCSCGCIIFRKIYFINNKLWIVCASVQHIENCCIIIAAVLIKFTFTFNFIFSFILFYFLWTFYLMTRACVHSSSLLLLDVRFCYIVAVIGIRMCVSFLIFLFNFFPIHSSNSHRWKQFYAQFYCKWSQNSVNESSVAEMTFYALDMPRHRWCHWRTNWLQLLFFLLVGDVFFFISYFIAFFSDA